MDRLNDRACPERRSARVWSAPAARIPGYPSSTACAAAAGRFWTAAMRPGRSVITSTRSEEIDSRYCVISSTPFLSPLPDSLQLRFIFSRVIASSARRARPSADRRVVTSARQIDARCCKPPEAAMDTCSQAWAGHRDQLAGVGDASERGSGGPRPEAEVLEHRPPRARRWLWNTMPMPAADPSTAMPAFDRAGRRRQQSAISRSSVPAAAAGPTTDKNSPSRRPKIQRLS